MGKRTSRHLCFYGALVTNALPPVIVEVNIHDTAVMLEKLLGAIIYNILSRVVKSLRTF